MEGGLKSQIQIAWLNFREEFKKKWFLESGKLRRAASMRCPASNCGGGRRGGHEVRRRNHPNASGPSRLAPGKQAWTEPAYRWFQCRWKVHLRRNRRCIPGPCRGRRSGQWDQHVCRKRGTFHKELVQEDSEPGCVRAGPRHDTHHLIAMGALERSSGEGRGSLSQCNTHAITWKKGNPVVPS